MIARCCRGERPRSRRRKGGSFRRCIKPCFNAFGLDEAYTLYGHRRGDVRTVMSSYELPLVVLRTNNNNMLYNNNRHYTGLAACS